MTAVALVVLAAVLAPGASGAAVPSPTVRGPIGNAGIRGHALWDSWFRLADVGYTEAEYFVSGRARSHSTPNRRAAYTTRIIVTRPRSPARFNGTVLLDWVNVTAQFENAVDSITAHELLLRDGYAYVHVSAQAAGICCTPLTPKVWDPVRYASLNHPGDDYAFDIFSQVAQSIRAPASIDPMAGLAVERVLAAGQSQSASRLYGYVTEVQPEAGVIDGFLVHGGGGKTYDPAPAAPVLHLLSDAEASPDEPSTDQNYRLWEIAGSAHSDFWIGYHQVVGQGPRSLLDAPQRPASADEEMHKIAGNYGEQPHPLHAACILAGSAFPMRYATSAAVDQLDRWVRTGVPAPMGPRFRFSGEVLARDRYGNALGGIRLPPIVHPVASYVSTLCGLGGITVPFTDVQLQLLYPTHAAYFCKMKAATIRSVDQGFLLTPDAVDLLTRAFLARNRWLNDGTIRCGGPALPSGIGGTHP
jgi:hypothetical protein